MMEFYKKGTQTTQYDVMALLHKFNGIYLREEGGIFIDGPGEDKINENINDLVDSLDDFCRLIWKKSDGSRRFTELVNGREMDFTLKVWLRHIYDLIMAYPTDGTNREILYAKAYLQQIKSMTSKYAELNIDTADRKDCSVREAQMGKEIFKVAIQLFGHFTIRCMFGNMVDYYVKGNDFNIKIISKPKKGDIEKFLKHVGLITKTSQYDKPVSFTGLRSRIDELRHLYGCFHLDSHLYLPMGDVKDDINRLDLPIGALVAVDPSSPIGGTDLKYLTKNIAMFFIIAYNKYAEDTIRFLSRQDDSTFHRADLFMKNFMRDQTNMLNVIKKKAYEKIVTGRYLGTDTALNLWYYESVINFAQKDFNLLTINPNLRLANLRLQCERFVRSHDYSRTLVFHQINDPIFPTWLPPIPFELRITQDDLIGITYNVYGDKLRSDTTQSVITDAKRDILSGKNKETVQLLEQAILNIEGGKAKLYPILNTHDPNLGYQFLEPGGGVAGDRNLKELPKGTGIFEIDLLNNYDDSIRMLDYVVNLMNTHTFRTEYDFGFVVKPIDGTKEDGIVSFGFNRHGIIQVGGFYSMQAPNSITDKYNPENGFNVLAIPFNEYSVDKVYVIYPWGAAELDIEEYIRFLSERWISLQDHNILWTYKEFLSIRDNNRDLLNNPEL
ncbi:MAG: hypothetical protein EU529_16500 [Promethearchaeota archaeon]|nr:MAG: hypothetical protein EU529_16500 [Candidatus Lokiarchaeota archaeon]